MLRELVLAIGIPLLVLLFAMLAREQWRNHLPSWLRQLALVFASGIQRDCSAHCIQNVLLAAGPIAAPVNLWAVAHELRSMTIFDANPSTANTEAVPECIGLEVLALGLVLGFEGLPLRLATQPCSEGFAINGWR